MPFATHPSARDWGAGAGAGRPGKERKAKRGEVWGLQGTLEISEECALLSPLLERGGEIASPGPRGHLELTSGRGKQGIQIALRLSPPNTCFYSTLIKHRKLFATAVKNWHDKNL